MGNNPNSKMVPNLPPPTKVEEKKTRRKSTPVPKIKKEVDEKPRSIDDSTEVYVDQVLMDNNSSISDNILVKKKKKEHSKRKRTGKKLQKPVKEWKNYGDEYYKKQFGEEDFKKYSELQFKYTHEQLEDNIYNQLRLRIAIDIAGAQFAALSVKNRGRATHNCGIGAIGLFTVVDNPLFPDHEFFVAKSTWPVRLRHANLSSTDDASVDIRSASIKFSDSNEGGPFDMIMNTGQGGVFWNLPTLQDRINAALAKDKVASQNEWLRKKPCNYAISCETLRRAPQSYTDQRYYSQLVYEFKAKDGKKRYVKYRLTPYDDIPETGLLSPEDQMQITKDFGKKDPNETRPFDYLRQEFKNKVDGPEGVHYRFQLQLHDWTDGDSYEYFNPNKPWDLKTHPWIDIGFIDLDKTLPEETIQNTCYNIANHPPSLGIIKPTSPEDYNSVAYARTKIYPISQWIRNHVHKEKGELKNPCEYFISAQTGNLKNAGTNANVSVTLYGTRGVTSNAALDIPWKDDRERGSKDNYIIKEEDVGDITYIKIEIDKHGNSPDWYLSYITVMSANTQNYYHFPIFKWILSPGTTVGEGTAELPQKASAFSKQQRSAEVFEHKKILKWTENTDLPNHANIEGHDNLPRNFQFPSEKMKSILQSKHESLDNMGLGMVKNLLIKFEDFHDYLKLFVTLPKPKFIKFWSDDVEFGSQILNGTNPTWITLVKQLPSNFPVTDEDVKGLLRPKQTIESEIRHHRMYLLDYEILDGIPLAKGRYLAIPLCLLYVNEFGQLVPIAIQLQQNPGPLNPIWTPNDSPEAWMYAKMWVRSSDFQVHQLSVHLLRTHLMMEPFFVAMYRNLSEKHPVWKILHPHFKNTLAINTIGRDRLIAPGGIVDQFLSTGGGGHIDLMKKVYHSWKFDKMGFEEDLKKRGVDNVDHLPGYYYRDDGLKVSAAIKEYVNGIISLYYTSDQDVIEDFELQEFIKDMHDNGYKEEFLSQHEFPDKFESVEQLTKMIKDLIFLCSAGHASANFGQFEFYGFIPNAPAALYEPIPTTKQVDKNLILKAIPNKSCSLKQMIFTWALSRYSEDEVFLGEYPDNLFVEPDAVKIQHKFQKELEKIGKHIDQRNSTLKSPYIYLHPKKVPNSIAV